MSSPSALEASRRRRNEEPLSQASQNLTRRSPPEYWDNLSTVWLTRATSPPAIDEKSPGTAEELYPHPAKYCKEDLRVIKIFARHGGPDLSDLRNYPDLQLQISYHQSMSTPGSLSRKRRAGSPLENNIDKATTKPSNTSAYSRNFQQHLADHGIYCTGYGHRSDPTKPSNWGEIQERLAKPRRSLSPSRFSESDFEAFVRADEQMSTEKQVTAKILPIIEGDTSTQFRGTDYPFTNLAPLTDGSLASAKPDHFFGAHPKDLTLDIRKALKDKIIPSTAEDRPMLLNFFFEAKGPSGSLPVASLQACYDGALAARGIHSLQSYKKDTVYDGNAYTVTSTYHGGTLRLFTTHIAAPTAESDNRPEYIMSKLDGWYMTGNSESFRKGATAYRNALEWTKEQRDMAIRSANERHMQSLPQVETDSALKETTSVQTVAPKGSNTSESAEPGPLDGSDVKIRPYR
ncbi:hypothetical protein MGYG_07994 [Nannizzia gypsea CBS 118893]|uniref:Uncharacterized protein n=1 Tax=Arthroderma gypseum (strain ATCC MYA-4604 / CBS 118893) TaxID=535722 RepID=E4V4R7_ARTGP|nr:hypothetical protein MGYG_07994 [Nannizzia gypsea CBS 118893]EFR04991.1 hypothetical protein MGYG_07994 [Nannizzia gypsea CBS 118893]